MYPARRGAAALAAAGPAAALLTAASRARAWEIGTLGAPLAPIPTIVWNIPGARRTAALEGTYRWNPAR